MTGRVLVAEDDDTVAEVVGRYLVRAGFAVSRVADGRAALQASLAGDPDLLILDLMLPGLSGLEVCARLRHRGRSLPVIMLTALGEEPDRVAGLRAGADDYLTKPFSVQELVLRVRAVLRRAPGRQPGPPTLLRDGDLEVDPQARAACLAGRPLPLTGREFDLLAFLLGHPDTVLTRKQLLAGVWGWSFGDTATVTVHIRRLREKIEADPAHPQRLITVWGAGYRLRPAGPR